MPESSSQSEPAAKAGMIKGYAAALRREGIYDKVRVQLSPAVIDLLENPPPASVWVGRSQIEPLHLAIEQVGGLQLVRKISREAVLVGLIPLARVVVDGFLRLFGATPHTLYSRAGDIARSSARGMVYDYRQVSDRSGVMTVRYPTESDMPSALFYVAAGGFEAMLEVAGVRGSVSDPEIVEGQRNAARFRIEWTPR